MLKHRSAARFAVPLAALSLAVVLGACNADPQEEEAIDEPVGGSESRVSLSITSPISSASMDTTDQTVSLSGTAKSDNGIYRVTWSTNKGESGIAKGTSTWQIDNVNLQLGENRITVTAEDTVGKTAARNITVRRESVDKGSATLSWNPPTSRVDGSPLTNLAGYTIHYGRMSDVYDYEIEIASPGLTTYVIENLVPGDWFFALAAYDSDGLESDRSNEVMRTIL